MRPLVITQNITVDGSIEMLDDWFDPTADDADMIEINQRDSAANDALVLGRQTFQDFRGYWPLQTNDETGTTDQLNRVQKYVVTSTMTDPQWENSTIVSDPVATVRELMDREGGEIVVTGSLTLCPVLIAAGLVTEYRLLTYPYVQGRGRRLFPDGHKARLRLEEQIAFRSGVTYTRLSTTGDRA